jgi:predicted protein tyrosine phosphatase
MSTTTDTVRLAPNQLRERLAKIHADTLERNNRAMLSFNTGAEFKRRLETKLDRIERLTLSSDEQIEQFMDYCIEARIDCAASHDDELEMLVHHHAIGTHPWIARQEILS